MRAVRLFALLIVAVAFVVPGTSEAARKARTATVQTNSGKTVELPMRKVGGKMMILVPMDLACDVFHGMSSGC